MAFGRKKTISKAEVNRLYHKAQQSHEKCRRCNNNQYCRKHQAFQRGNIENWLSADDPDFLEKIAELGG